MLLCLLFSGVLYANQERVELIDREGDTIEANSRVKQGFIVMPVFYHRKCEAFSVDAHVMPLGELNRYC